MHKKKESHSDQSLLVSSPIYCQYLDFFEGINGFVGAEGLPNCIFPEGHRPSGNIYSKFAKPEAPTKPFIPEKSHDIGFII